MAKILVALLILAVIPFVVTLANAYKKRKAEGKLEDGNFFVFGAIGAIANFFDTLGLGSFAVETALFKNFKLVDDQKLPGTLNAANTIPAVIQACIMLTVVQVNPLTLFSMIGAALIGGIVGASIISKLPKKSVQLVMTVALGCMGLTILAGLLGWIPSGGTAMGLTGWKLIVAVIGNFIFGALNSVGVGLFAPCMSMVYVLGMSPLAAFPIMMGSCAMLLPFAGMKYVKEDVHNMKATVAVSIMGPIGVLAGVTLVKGMDMELLKWLLLFVILYTSFGMFKSYKQSVAMEKNIDKAA